MLTNVLKQLVSFAGKTQKEIAASLGLSQQRFNAYVNGIREPDIATLILLADYFGVTVDYLIGHEKEPTVKDDGLTEMERLFLSLPRERRQETLRFMEYQLSQASDE